MLREKTRIVSTFEQSICPENHWCKITVLTARESIRIKQKKMDKNPLVIQVDVTFAVLTQCALRNPVHDIMKPCFCPWHW